MAAVKRTATSETVFPSSTRIVRVEDGSPWAIRLHATCHSAKAGDPPTPRIVVSIEMGDSHVGHLGQVDDLLGEKWREFLENTAMFCSDSIATRQVQVPDSFRSSLLEALRESRMDAIRSIIRYQASSLIRHISSNDACRIWSEIEIGHIFDS